MLDARSMILVDVREPHGSSPRPISPAPVQPTCRSRFDPADVPTDERKRVVFSCSVGGRCFKALEMAKDARTLSVDAHLGGGLEGRLAAGLPVERG